MSVPPTTAPVYCRAEMNYLGSVEREAIEVDILDGRAGLESRDFDECGFTMRTHSSAVTDWTDQQHIHEVHGPEVLAFAEEFTGCDAAVVYPPILRGPEMAAVTPDYAPIEFVHSDFTTDYKAMITDPKRSYQQFLEPRLAAHGMAPADVRGASRLMVLQLWRNTGQVTPDFPLAVLDPRSIDPDRLRPFLVESYGGVHELQFETYGIASPPADVPDRWYTFPSLEREEVLVFRTYDSARADSGLPFWTPHSAFRDPHAPPGPPRESTEMRALCIWR